MENGIRGNGVNLLVTPAVSIDGTTEVGLLVQDIIPLQHHGEGLAAQETIAQLRIPNQFVGVQRSIGIAALAIYVEIGREYRP